MEAWHFRYAVSYSTKQCLLWSAGLGSNPSSATEELCDHGQVIKPLCVLVTPISKSVAKISNTYSCRVVADN